MDKEQIVELKISAKDLDKFDMKAFFGHEAAQLNKSFSQFDIDKNEQDNDHTLIDNYEDVDAFESDKECTSTSENSFEENKSQSQMHQDHQQHYSDENILPPPSDEKLQELFKIDLFNPAS